MADPTLSAEVQFLKGVGPRLAPAFAKLNLRTVADVLYHFPRRYEDRRNLPRIRDLVPGQFATIRGRITQVDARPTRGGMMIIKATIRDASGSAFLVWFNQPWVRKALEHYRGEVLAYGQVKEGDYAPEIAAPEWEKIDEDADPEEFARIVAVYPLTEGVTQRSVRSAVRSAIDKYVGSLADPLPESIRRENDLRPIVWSLRQMHFPEEERLRLMARRRLVFEEFLYMQLALAMRRAETQLEMGIGFPIAQLLAGAELPAAASARTAASGELRDVSSTLFAAEAAVERDREPFWAQVGRMLPFTLTGAQQRVVGEILHDMAIPVPMNRLVQGDVGSGKTAVAACAMLAAVRSGYQAALMAPTEILAEQHAANLRRLFEPLGITVELLVGKLGVAAKRKAAERTASGLASIAVGTHALIQDGISFRNLGLVIVDEQHRFGVRQRMALREKGMGNPDVLVMTATPIPRSLTMTMYGDLDVSIIDELPPGRREIKTHFKRPSERVEVFAAVAKLVASGRQAYFVCPMVSENEKMQAQAAEELHLRLSTQVYPDLRVGLLHGQMKSADKERVMDEFRRHELDILVSTTVIEVGVDVPNASVMVIEDANRFGLSQLHQLRGRVGRGVHQSFCVLIADAKSEDAQKRMDIMVATTDGFRIAEEDLRLRGPGELAGTKQSGNLDFKLADLVQDGEMLIQAREVAKRIVQADPKLEKPENQLMCERIQDRWSSMAVVTVS
ncbi:MAG: ATP-dependent DNA helicase RecG [Fimbriimonas sp.]